MGFSVGVLALQGGVAEHAEAARAAGAEPVLVRRPEELASVDALILPGGESTAMTKLLAVTELAEPLGERLKGGMPAFGSCAGLILLAEAVDPPDERTRNYGAIDITVRRNAFGRQVDSFEEDLDVPELGPDPARAVFIRAPWVVRAGPGVQTLATVASSDGAEPKIVAARQGNILVTAFHPELTADIRWHALFLSMARA
ncbi:pyridoxal 5'-phosphate synthase glutaminase subunit PdxT [Segniliparus rugosus]|uniref:Pyridoxal 5'-phosphate synthase subunit PdxT n=1 Tax=Segniliparus rugosus (strain ATCC BAA-974 / DSM 45345 / CCUG 50838 / CIP 108380 / JCM 13579 / CDC 945) TaxID=679197 RepID=E5XT80_SEGRC|nr:pyridoxal 5'-phosphate synthase glutaminase subunit PdxT [Segniliparus rugosus]EFV12411.1 pyridoxal 5'-phosphate synthase, glutaminase subunit Pdx2 [Segniliparus rugosus ATCC BAA-974]